MSSISKKKKSIITLKILSSICFLLISLSCIFANSNLVSGYELSIYSSTSPFVWIFLIVCVSISLFIILHQIYTDQYKMNFFWIILIFIVLIQCRFVLLSIPYIRGYVYPWRGDSLTHIGYAIDILSSGHFGVTNYYPITHILLANLVLFSGSSVEVISKYITPFLSTVHTLFIYLFAKSVFSDKEFQITSLVIACLTFNIYDFAISPNGWSILYLPLLLSYLFFESFEYRVILIISLILMPFFHVLTSTVYVFALFLILIINIVCNQIKNKGHILYYGYLKKWNTSNAVILESVILSLWVLFFKSLNKNIKGLYDLLIRDRTDPAGLALGVSEKLDKVHIQGIDVILLAIKIYGDMFIFIGFIFVALFIFIKSINKNKFNLNFLIILVLSLSFLGIYLLYFFNIIPGLKFIAGHRLLMYLVVFTPISTTFVLKYFKSKTKKAYFSICVFLVLIASIISMLSLYQSPWIIKPNSQVTQMEINGMEWYFNYHDSIDSVCIMTPPIRYADVIFGVRERISRDIVKYYDHIPDHFNYTIYNTIGESYNEDKYAIISKYDRVIYTTVWKPVGRFSDHDFIHLESDVTANKVYNNYELDVWYINHA